MHTHTHTHTQDGTSVHCHVEILWRKEGMAVCECDNLKCVLLRRHEWCLMCIFAFEQLVSRYMMDTAAFWIRYKRHRVECASETEFCKSSYSPYTQFYNLHTNIHPTRTHTRSSIHKTFIKDLSRSAVHLSLLKMPPRWHTWRSRCTCLWLRLCLCLFVCVWLCRHNQKKRLMSLHACVCVYGRAHVRAHECVYLCARICVRVALFRSLLVALFHSLFRAFCLFL